jgi:hypothetical protein
MGEGIAERIMQAVKEHAAKILQSVLKLDELNEPRFINTRRKLLFKALFPILAAMFPFLVFAYSWMALLLLLYFICFVYAMNRFEHVWTMSGYSPAVLYGIIVVVFVVEVCAALPL